MKLLLPFWLVFLAALSGLPAVGRASDRAFPLVISQPQTAAGPVSGLPTPAILDRSQQQDRNPPTESSSRPNLRFDRLSATDGLSYSFTTSILQDQQGFMWFGTRYGLNQFDGFDFKVFVLGPSGDVLFANYIRALYQDRAGNLWISNLVDLVRRDIKTGEFVHYKTDAANPQSLGPGQIYPIAEDAAGTLWVGTTEGLNRYDPSTAPLDTARDALRTGPSTETFTRFLPDVSVLSILVDRQGGTWLGTGGYGLWHYARGSPGQEEPEIYRHDPSDPNSLSDDLVWNIIEDQQGALWVGTYYSGLYRLDPATGKFTHFQHNPEDPQSLSDNSVRSILEDSTGRLWIGTDNGLNLFDRTTGRFFQYHYDPGDPHSLSSDAVWDIYEDRSGVLWIATLGGISKLNETASRFTHYQQEPNPLKGTVPGRPDLDGGVPAVSVLDPRNPPGLSGDSVSSVYQDRQGIVWIGISTISTGRLNRLDRSTGSVTVYQHDPDDPTSLSAGPVYTIYGDRAGTLWIGTLDGLNRFNPQTESFEAEEAFRGRRVTSIVEDQQGALWVGYWGGLYRREPGASDFTMVRLERDWLATDRVHTIYPDRTGAVWVSVENGGLFQWVPATGGGSKPTVIHFPQTATDPRSPGVGTAMSFYEDSQGTLWMSSVEDGLVRFDRDTQTFTHYAPDTGPARYVSCIQGDAQGFVWMGTALGLARFDPASETFSYFDTRDGLVIGEGSACFQNQQGEILFGSSQGLNTFFPDQIRDNPNPPVVAITALNLKNQPLRTDLLPDEQIKLSYRENYLSFDFAALDYTAPAKNQYAYKMEGLEADWVEAGTRRHADYPDLKPGTYTFRVKASNNSGVWNEQGAAVHITITPPFWQTGWFLGLLGVALLGIVVGGVRLRLKGVEARSRNLERQVGERTGALEQKTLEIERRRQELEALLSADDRMQRYLHQDQVLQALVDVAVDNMRADKSAVIWWDEKREKLVMRVARGFDPQVIREIYFLPGEGIVAGVAQSGEPALVEDSLADPRRNLENPRSVKFAQDEGIRSFMFFPITIGEEVVGVFNVSYNKPHAVGEEEKRLFQALTQRAALQIENARLYERSQELAVLEERSRLARELHDAVTQTLFSASLVAEALPTTWERDLQEGRGLLQELRGLCRGALAEMRTLLLELRPARLVETRLDDLLRQLGEAASGREGIPVTVQVEGQASARVPLLPPDVHIALYRITQEALNNVVKHARAHQVIVRLYYACQAEDEAKVEARQVLLSISDDGRGFDPAQVPHDRLGLGNMQERAQAIGAHLTIESQPGHGTQVTVLWETGRDT